MTFTTKFQYYQHLTANYWNTLTIQFHALNFSKSIHCVQVKKKYSNFQFVIRYGWQYCNSQMSLDSKPSLTCLLTYCTQICIVNHYLLIYIISCKKKYNIIENQEFAKNCIHISNNQLQMYIQVQYMVVYERNSSPFFFTLFLKYLQKFKKS